MDNQIAILDIPHILEEIGKNLSSHHLTKCVLVSKEWNKKFIPLLYSNLPRHINTKIVLQHPQHVRSINTVSSVLGGTTEEKIILPNLRVARIEVNTEFGQVLSLLSHTALLKSLFIFFFNNSDKDLLELANTIQQRLPKLKSLSLYLYSPTSLETLQQLIYSSRHCSRVSLIVNLRKTTTKQIEDYKNSIKGWTDVMFEDLNIRILCAHSEIDIITPLLEQAPRVKTFYLPYPYTLNTLDRISHIFQNSGRCGIKSFGFDHDTTQDRSSYWKAIHNLSKVISKENHDWSDIRNPTHSTISQTIHLSQKTCDGSLSKNISLYLSGTLTKLDLWDLSFGDFALLLSRSPLLQGLSAYVNFDTFDQEKIDLDALKKISWTCLGLRKLSIKLKGLDARCKGIALEKVVYMFGEIGKLHNLEDWKFSSGSRLLTKEHISLLKNLKQLRRLDLRDYRSMICLLFEEDISMMLESWHKLNHIILNPELFRPGKNIIQMIKQKNNIQLDILPHNSTK